MHVSAGQKLTVDLNVEAEPFYSVNGSLLAPPGVGGWVRLVPRGLAQRDSVGAMMRRNTGTFTFRMVAAGDYTLEAQGQSEGKMWSAFMPVHVAADIDGLQVAMSPTVTIPVNVQVQRTQSTVESTVGSGRSRMPMNVQVLLRRHDQQQPQMFGASFQRPNDSSSLAIANVTPGTYSVEFHPFSDLYVASARYGNTDLQRDDLVISSSASQDPIDIVLRDDGGRVKGTVTVPKDEKLDNCGLVVIPEHGVPHIQPVQLQRGGGEFALRQLRPGSYSILAFSYIGELEYMNPDALEPYMSHAAHVDVSANQETSITVELIRRSDEEQGED
jgi:hypothetical protein